MSSQHFTNFEIIIFKVRTVLENPTRYHVIQKQKTQVRQYLSESFQQSEWENGSQNCSKDQMDYVRFFAIMKKSMKNNFFYYYKLDTRFQYKYTIR